MLYTFAHAGYSHDMDSMTMLDHCTPIIIGAGIVIAMLLTVILLLLVNRRPKTQDKAPTGATAPKKRSAKKS